MFEEVKIYEECCLKTFWFPLSYHRQLSKNIKKLNKTVILTCQLAMSNNSQQNYGLTWKLITRCRSKQKYCPYPREIGLKQNHPWSYCVWEYLVQAEIQLEFLFSFSGANFSKVDKNCNNNAVSFMVFYKFWQAVLLSTLSKVQQSNCVILWPERNT